MRSGCYKVNYICACGLNEWGEKMSALLKCELIGNGKSEVWMLNMNWANMWWVMIDL